MSLAVLAANERKVIGDKLLVSVRILLQVRLQGKG